MQTSESIEKLTVALIKAKKAFAPLIKMSENPHFRSKYADLAATIEATDQALLDNELILIQSPEKSETVGTITVVSRLIHSSGQWIENSLPMPAGQQQRYDAQTVGSAITYGRRYAYMALLGIAAEDDDGEVASGRQERRNEPKPVESRPTQPALTTTTNASGTGTSQPSTTTDGEETDSAQGMIKKAKELYTIASAGIDRDKFFAFLKTVGFKPETEHGKAVSVFTSVVKQGLYQSAKSWLQTNKKAA